MRKGGAVRGKGEEGRGGKGKVRRGAPPVAHLPQLARSEPRLLKLACVEVRLLQLAGIKIQTTVDERLLAVRQKGSVLRVDCFFQSWLRALQIGGGKLP